MAIDRPETNAGAPQRGWTAQEELSCSARNGGNTGVPMRLAAWGGPSGEESCDDAVALKRSKRIALFFGQIRPLKRPFGAVETRGLNGDVAILRPHHDDQTGNTGLAGRPASQAMRISLPDLFYRHCPQPGSGQSTTLALTVKRSYGPRLCLKLIRCLVAVCHHLPDEDGR